MASHPGNLRVNYVRWVLFKPKWPLIGTTLLVGSLLLVGYFPGVLTTLLVLLLACLNFFYWRRVCDHFRYGCANLAVVVDLQPTLIAVSTDLSKGIGDFPVIKTRKANITRSAGEPLKVGDLLPTVSLYEPAEDEKTPHWANFDPVPADYVTSKAENIQTLLANFEKKDLKELQDGLKHISQPYSPGLYLLWPEPGKAMGRLASAR